MCVCATGGNLKGGSLVAGDVDIDTSGGDVQIGRLMGNDVDVSTQDRGVASAGSGTVSIGAVYADMLHLSSGTPCIRGLLDNYRFILKPITMNMLASRCMMHEVSQ